MIKINQSLFPGFSDFIPLGLLNPATKFSAIYIKMNQKVLIEVIPKSDIITETTKKKLFDYLNIVSSLDHPFISTLYGVTEDNDNFYIISEFLPNGNLLEHLYEFKKIKEPDLQKIFCQLSSAIKYLHSNKNIIHRDIQLKNIMFDNQMNIRLVDFSLSSILTTQTMIFNDSFGSLSYSSPEIIKKKQFSKKSDIWSLGIVLYSMNYGLLPFIESNNENLVSKIMNNQPDYLINTDTDVGIFLQKLLEKDFNLRYSIEDFLYHPFINSSRYSFYLTDEFLRSSKYSNLSDPNNEMRFLLNKFNINEEISFNDIKNNFLSEHSMCYKMIRKEKIYELLTSNEEIKNMYYFKSKESSRNLSGQLIRNAHHSILSNSPIPQSKLNSLRNPSNMNLLKIDKNIVLPKPTRRNTLPKQSGSQSVRIFE